MLRFSTFSKSKNLKNFKTKTVSKNAKFLSKKNYHSKNIFFDGKIENQNIENTTASLSDITLGNAPVTPEQVMIEYGGKLMSGEVERGLFSNYLSVELVESGTYTWYNYALFPFQYVLETLHVIGMPWWGAIIGVSVLMRLGLAPFFIKQQVTTAKLADCSPQLEALQEKQKRNPHLAATMREDMMKVYSDAGVSPFTAMKYSVLQVPIFVVFFITIRKMCEGWPEFHTGGASFFADLAAVDPYMRLPILSAICSILLMETQPTPKPMSSTMKWVFRVMMIAFIGVASYFPMGVHIYWISSGLMSIAFGLAFRSTKVRKYFGMKPLGKAQYMAKNINLTEHKPK